MKPVNYSVFYKDCKTKGIEYAARHSRELGFDAVEFLDFAPMREDSVTNTYRALEVNNVLGGYGLSVSCCSVAVDLLHNDRGEKTEQMHRQIEFAAEVGSPFFHHTLLLSLDPRAAVLPYEDALEAIYPHAVAIANRCKEYGITCLYEPQGLYFNGVEGLGRFFARIKGDCPNVGICGDVGNGLFVDNSAIEIYDAFVGDVKHVHLKDYRVENAPVGDARAYLSRAGRYLYECPLGEGSTDLDYCFAKLKQAGYTGGLSFEIGGDDDSVKKAIELVRQKIKE